MEAENNPLDGHHPVSSRLINALDGQACNCSKYSLGFEITSSFGNKAAIGTIKDMKKSLFNFVF